MDTPITPSSQHADPTVNSNRQETTSTALFRMFLRFPKAAALKPCDHNPYKLDLRVELLSEVETAKGRKRLKAVLNKRPFPHFKPVAGHPELICRIEDNGSETIGRFVGREFIAVEVPR